MPDSYRVAAIQFEPQLGDKAGNTARLLELTATAARNGARLIVLPEMATTGYCWYSRDEIRPHVEPIPGPTSTAFGELSRDHQCWIVLGMPELAPATGIFYNSAALIGPDGPVGVYRKTHSFASDLRWAKDGDHGLPVWETPLGRIGILICMDAGYWEPARLLALRGADVLCFPTNWLGETSPGPAWIARAWENGCYLIGANRYGLERGVQFEGGSCVLGPDGTIQALRPSGDGIVYGEVRPTSAREARRGLLAARRPELYDNLTLNAYLWEPLEYHGLYNHRPLPAGRRSSIAVAQLAPVAGDIEANLRRMEGRLEELRGGAELRPDGSAGAGLASAPNVDSDAETVDLVVFPEYMLTGCPDVATTAIALDAQAAAACHDRLVQLSRHYGVYLVAGYAEASTSLPDRPGASTSLPNRPGASTSLPNRPGASTSLPDRPARAGQTFSAAVLVGPQGVVAQYRKAHVMGDETAWCCPGSAKPPVVDLPLGRVGLLLGTDLCVPEAARCLAIEGCDVLVVPAGPGLPPASSLPPAETRAGDAYHFHLARQRAFENNCYLAYAALPGADGHGGSAIFGPGPSFRAGERILPRDAAGSVVRAIDTLDRSPVRDKELVRKRRTDLYDALQQP